MRRPIALFTMLAVAASGASAQQGGMSGMQHTPGMAGMPGMTHEATPTRATESGQAAFAAISEVVRLLKADSTTDWSKVNLEALRQHLIDMDNVTMRAKVSQQPVPGGMVMNVTGTATVTPAIQRMVGMHAMMLGMSMGEGEPTGLAAKAVKIPGGMRLTVTARDTADTRLVARIRGLGFIGLMTEGEHHQMHHMMVARGGAMMH